ncbi:unnamed protein product [Paramecium pentaurelia]|uniref:Uncharacterized protein n=1 Tax=Paramecium pentaurelia TaxID=43138 RepID=A0A8S1VAX5_9CILI|nr:unnamed protein product [Paramecium pentaurelia]
MFFNFGRFFGFGQQPKFDNLLKKDNLTIECIFNEDDILQELKGTSSSKFADFLIKHPQEYLKMINYIVEEIPDQCTEKNRCVKYPFYGSEILGSENDKLINFLFEKPTEESQEDVRNPIDDNEETEQIESLEQNNNIQENEIIRAGLLDNLLKLLESDSIIITTAGYFAKVINSIINKKGYYFWEHLKHYPDIISNLFKHSYLKHIVDIFEKLIIMEENYDQSTEYMNERLALLQRLVVFLKGKQHSSVIVGNICELFVELYRKSIYSFDNQQQEYKNMLVQFTITTTPLFFMNLAQATQQSVVYQILNVQFEFLNKFQLSDQSNEVNINLIQLYKPVIQLLEKAIIQVDIFKIPFISADGIEVRPLGDAKLFIIQLIVQLIQKSEFYRHFTAELFCQIINLVKLHPNNNQLHLLFEKLIVELFEKNDEFLHRLILDEAQLLQFIIQNNDEKARQNKYGFKGILTRLSNYLNSNKNKSNLFQVSQYLLTQMQIDWDEYMKGLERVNKIEQEWILGINPRQKEQKIIEEIISPNIQEENQEQNHIIQGIRKCISSDNNDVIQPKDVDNEDFEIDEEIQLDFQEKQNQDEQIQEKEQHINEEQEHQKDLEEVIESQNIEINQTDQDKNQIIVENKQEEQESNLNQQENQKDSNILIDKSKDQVQDQQQLNDNLDISEDPQKLQEQEPEETQEIIKEQVQIKEDNEVEKEEIQEEIVQSQDALEDQSIKNEEEQQKQNIEQENQNKEEPKQIE